MTKTIFHRVLTAVIGVLVLLISGVVASSSAVAAQASPSGPQMSYSTDSVAVDESNPVLPSARQKIKEAGGDAVLATWTGTFVPTNKSVKQTVTANGIGSCTISGVGYFTYRTTSRSSVYNDGITYCPGPTGVVMHLGILKEDTVWGNVSQVAYKQVTGNGPEAKSEAEYSCPTGNLSGFEATADGTLNLGGTQYGVVQASRGFQRFNCG